MHWRSLLLVGLIAVVPTAALAGDLPPIDLAGDLAGQAVLGSLTSVTSAELTERRGPGGQAAKLDYLAGLAANTASVYRRAEVVPEPTTGLLLLLGLSGLALRRR